jgi:nicotinamidase-related amidase
MKPALLVIDIQKEFFKDDEGTIQSLKSAVAYINAAIALFREKSLPVISIQHIDEAEGLTPGNIGFDLPDDLNILPGDLHIYKKYSNAFIKTSLAENLRNLGADPIILSGYCAEYCVLSTYRGAMDLDLNPILLRDALASGSEENIRFVERISDVISLGALESFMDLD